MLFHIDIEIFNEVCVEFIFASSINKCNAAQVRNTIFVSKYLNVYSTHPVEDRMDVSAGLNKLWAQIFRLVNIYKVDNSALQYKYIYI